MPISERLTGGATDSVSTTLSTGNINQAQRVVDMDDRIHLLEPSQTPLVVLLMKLRKRTTFNPKFEWLEDDLSARWSSVGANYTSADTTITVATGQGSFFRVNDLVLHVVSGEIMRVTGVPNDNSITVQRAWAGTASAGTIGDKLLIIGNVNPEGAKAPDVRMTVKTNQFNYTQIFRNAFSITETTRNSRLYGGDELAYQRKKVAIEHMVDIERAFLFGKRREDLSGAAPQRSTGGVFEFITSNVEDVNGTLSISLLENFIRVVMRYGSQDKVFFCSRLLTSVISLLAQGKVQMRPLDETFGIAVSTYISPHGRVNIIPHNLLEGSPTTEYGGHGILLDLEDLYYRPLNNRDTKLRINIQSPDEDQEKDEYITEAGLMLTNEVKHGVMKRVTG